MGSKTNTSRVGGGIPADLPLVHMVGGEAAVPGPEIDRTGQNDALRHRHAASSLASVQRNPKIHKRSDQPLMPEGLVTGCEMVDGGLPFISASAEKG